MSKKRGGKKNQNLDDFDDDNVGITSKPVKTKAPKKGKGNAKNDDWSDNEESIKMDINISEDELPPATKKSAKKSKFSIVELLGLLKKIIFS